MFIERYQAWLKTVTQYTWSDFIAARRRYPGQTARQIDTIADSAEAQSDQARQIEEGFDLERFEVTGSFASRDGQSRPTGRRST